MENDYINDIVSIVKCHTQTSEAITLYSQLNIVDFIRDVELECARFEQFNNIEEKNFFPLTSRDLLFLCTYTDINKLGSYSDNLYKSFSECVIEHWDKLKTNVVDFYQLISEIRKKTDLHQHSGYSKNLLEICLTSSLFSTVQVRQLLRNGDVNVALHKSGNTALQNMLTSNDSILKLNNLPCDILETLLHKTKYTSYNHNGIDVLEALWEKKHLLNEHIQDCIQTVCKPVFLKQLELNYLILECVFYGKKKDLFTEKELKTFIDQYIDLDFSINFLNKNHKIQTWNYKAKNLVSWIEKIEDLPQHLQDKLKEIQNHPQYFAAKKINPAQINISEPYLVIDYPIKKQVCDHVLYYMLEKCELVFKNSYFEIHNKKNFFDIIYLFKEKKSNAQIVQH